MIIKMKLKDKFETNSNIKDISETYGKTDGIYISEHIMEAFMANTAT
jgi:hypothetical protein